MREFVVYSRRGCHLCEDMLETLEPLCRGRAGLEVRDVDMRPDWVELYGPRVPVLCCDGSEVCHFHLDRNAVLALLGLPAGESR